MKKLSLYICCLMAAGCNGGSPQFETSSQGLEGLNELAKQPNQDLTFQFSQVQIASATALQPITADPPGTVCSCPVGQNCPCPSPPIVTSNPVAFIAGQGTIVDPVLQDLGITFFLAVTYDLSLPNGELCLQKAEDALIKNVSFTIHGKATLIPIDPPPQPTPEPLESGGTGGGAPGFATNVSGSNSALATQVVSQASGIDQGVITNPPVFYNPSVGVLLTTIDSCSESQAALPPTNPSTVGASPPVPVANAP